MMALKIGTDAIIKVDNLGPMISKALNRQLSPTASPMIPEADSQRNRSVVTGYGKGLPSMTK